MPVPGRSSATLGTMRIAVLLTTCWLLGCVPNHATISTDAIVSADGGGGCRITIKGMIPDMAHGPLTFLMRGQSELDAIFLIPSLTGTYDASQVRMLFAFPGKKTYPGTTETRGHLVSDGKMLRIDMTDIDDSGREKPFLYNGTFTLIHPASCGA
jgi:hypothetical protein